MVSYIPDIGLQSYIDYDSAWICLRQIENINELLQGNSHVGRHKCKSVKNKEIVANSLLVIIAAAAAIAATAATATVAATSVDAWWIHDFV